MYQAMHVSGAAARLPPRSPPSPTSSSTTQPRQQQQQQQQQPKTSSHGHSSVREAFAFLTRSSSSSSSKRQGDHRPFTFKKRPPPLQLSSTTSSGRADASDPRPCRSPALRSPDFQSFPEMACRSMEAQNPTTKTVVVRYRGTNVTIHITKSTSVDDLVARCGHVLGRAVDPATCVVVEPYARLGLERRLRRYELVWDVVAAWDDETGNALVIQADAPDPDGELSLDGVPLTSLEPDGFTMPMYWLQRPGKWSERYVTLRENGKMFASKKADWTSADKDVVRLCHLDDFDVYSPTEAEMRKNLKPPKRYCYAIRSQQRASLFADSNFYVRYVCTGDADAASRFRAAVHGWRSWYLVNKKLNLREPTEEPSSPASHASPPGCVRHGRRPSFDQGPHGPSSTEGGERLARPYTAHRESTPLSDPPLSPLSPGSQASPRPAPAQKAEHGVFLPGGLLGEVYEQRKQQALQERQRRGTGASGNGHPDDGPFINGPSLLNRSRAGTAAAVDSHGRPQTGESDGGGLGSASKPTSPTSPWFPSALRPSAEPRSAREQVAASLARRPSTASHAPSRSFSVRHQDPRHPAVSPPLTRLPDSNHRPGHHGTSSSPSLGLGQNHQVHQAQNRQPLLAPSPLPPPPSSHHHHHQQKPLIDLTPTFIEAPQWSSKNRGHGVRAPQGAPLVDFATGNAAPFCTATRYWVDGQEPPPSKLVRRPGQEAGLVSPAGGGGSSSSSMQAGPTLMEQYEARVAGSRARARSRPGEERMPGRAGTGMGMGMGMGMDERGSELARRHTVRGVGGGGTASRSHHSYHHRSGTVGGSGSGFGLVSGSGSGSGPGSGVDAVPPVPAVEYAALQDRVRLMGLGDADADRTRAAAWIQGQQPSPPRLQQQQQQRYR
ncbi:hypothetical protein VTJ83DRAFT_1911 [Remersonia thermophila]|uniref:PH domain-containing protein n=1 Tax=Remersonia thermophila TaxID=72144 RepID=A0ABR4DHJ7_9PEZI